MVSIKAGCCTFNPVTPMGRKFHQMQMILLPFISILVLVIQNCYAVFQIIVYQNHVRELQLQVDGAVDMGTVLTALQRERVEVAYYIFSNATRLTTALEDIFRMTDNAIEKVQSWPKFSLSAVSLGSKLRFQIRLENLREWFNEYGVTVKKKVSYYTLISAHIMDAIIRNIKDTNISNIWKLMVAYKDIIRAVEYFGISMVEGLNFFGEGRLSKDTYVNYVTYDTLGWKTLNQTKDFVTIIKEKLDNITQQYENVQNVFKWRAIITENVAQVVDFREADNYFYVMVQLSNELRKMQEFLLVLIKDYMKKELESTDRKAAISIFLLVLTLILSPIIIFRIRNDSTTIQICAKTLTSKTNLLKIEKRRCARLLRQLLPQPIVHQLKNRQPIPAQRFDLVTVYVSDIVGFSKLSSESTPAQVVSLLNSLYKLFDSHIEYYDVYKLETIGDSHMIVSGAPHANGKRHVSEIAKFSLDLMDSTSKVVIPHRPNRKLQMRAGFHTGPVVAGVIGLKMVRYCVFGETLTRAEIMKSTGEATKVHISQESKELLDEEGGFSYEFNERQDIKGFDTVHTYWLTSAPESGQQTKNVKKD